MFYLAGDIGGTKTHLALYKDEGEECTLLRDQKYPSKDFPNLRTIIKAFLENETKKVSRGCFGIAGPVKDGKSQATNLPWLVDHEQIEKETAIKKVALINDLEANAYGLNLLKKEEFFVLNEGEVESDRNQALISAGTGLGEAGLVFDGKRHLPFATEGGHGDFGARSEIEDELLLYLRKKFGHVSYERILSGPGLFNVYEFLVETKKETETKERYEEIKKGDAPKMISEFGLKGESFACARALDLFVTIYGAEAGNLALRLLALGGVFVGGGIAPKLLDIIKSGGFIKGFKEKGRFGDLLSAIPVRVVLNTKTALLGSLYYAKHLLDEE